MRQLGLRLLGLVLLVAEALHEAFEPGDVHVEPIERLLGVLSPRGLLHAPLVPRPFEVQRPTARELEHAVRHRLEEPAVVGNEDHGGVEGLELALEPLDALDVQVVGRLVEEQEVGIAGKRARQ